MESLTNILILLALLGSGLMAGVFYVFSVSVMSALARIPSHEGIRAMQSINKTIINPLFLGSFMGTAIISLILVVMGISGHLQAGTSCFVTGALLYIVGTFILTAAGNVPMNDKLDTVDPTSGDAYWKIYLRNWTRLNHIRTACSLTACALFAIGLIQN